MIPLVNLPKQYLSIKDEIDKAVAEVITNGDFILGDDVRLFEKEYAEFIGTKFCVGVSSGFSALTLSLKALGVGPGDEIITSANTFIATILGALHLGVTVKLVDVREKTFNLDEDKLQKEITDKTKVIIPVHLYGRPCSMDEILEIAKKKNIKILEDSAQSQGAQIKRKMVGSFGEISAFSFYPGKNLGAFGDAGAVVTNDEDLAEQVKILRNVGQKEKYNHVVKGYNERLDTLQAAVLRVKLRHLKSWNQKRVQIANWYQENLVGAKVVLPEIVEGHVWHQYSIQLENRDEVGNYLLEKGIATGVHYLTALHLQPALKDLGYQKGDFPVAEKLSSKILSLPIYPELEKNEVEFIATTLKEVL